MKFVILCLAAIYPAFALGPLIEPSDVVASTGSADLEHSSKPYLKCLAPVDTDTLIRAAAERRRVPLAFLESIVAAESSFNQAAISSKGAKGLMQLMPATAREYGANPSIPEENIDAGTRYLRALMDKYKRYRNSLLRVIAAYNAGPTKIDHYHGVPPFPETRRYVARVLHLLKRFQKDVFKADLSKESAELTKAR